MKRISIMLFMFLVTIFSNAYAGSKNGVEYDSVAKDIDGVWAVSNPKLLVDAQYYPIEADGDIPGRYVVSSLVCKKLGLPFKNVDPFVPEDTYTETESVVWREDGSNFIHYDRSRLVAAIRCRLPN